ncbi:MAG TPA: hypothetical protein VGB17_19780 [Pyrinomonadaceae bacterium]|jgi:hypothetical protein
MLRAAALSILILVSMAVVLPLVNSTAHNNRSTASRRFGKGRHSRAWWRRYRARLRRKRAAALRRQRELASGRLPKTQNPALAPESNEKSFWGRPSTASGGEFNHPQGISLTMPFGWSTRPVVSEGETRFRVYALDGRAAGEAVLSFVSPARSGNNLLPGRNQRKMLAGLPFTELRRLVINKMLASNGWVINDFEREIGGRRFFIVLAQTAADSNAPQQSWSFYFTELDGRIYSFSTHAPLEFADRIAAESEQVMASLRLRNRASIAATPLSR